MTRKPAAALTPALQAALDKSEAAYQAMSPEEKGLMWAAQRRSWVVGEMMLEHPEMTRERATEIYYNVVTGSPK